MRKYHNVNDVRQISTRTHVPRSFLNTVNESSSRNRDPSYGRRLVFWKEAPLSLCTCITLACITNLPVLGILHVVHVREEKAHVHVKKKTQRVSLSLSHSTPFLIFRNS